MNLSYSERAAQVKPSPTLTLDAQAKAMKAEGRQIVNLSIGEPDFETPEHIKQAAIRAVTDGFTRYTPANGILPLREAMSEKFKTDNGLDYSPDEIVVTNGGKHALYNAMQALFNPGDEVIIPSPYWVTYPPQVVLAGARPVIVGTRAEHGYVLQPEDLEKAITPRTKGIIINSPSNPTGMIYPEEALQKLADVLVRHPIWIISDDIYEKLLYDDTVFSNIPMCRPELKERTVICHAVSKTYSMTGWRIGFLAAPAKVAKTVTVIQGQMTSNPCSIAQKAALAALTGTQEPLLRMRNTFDRRRRLILELIGKIPCFSSHVPQGAFYVFPDVSKVFGTTLGGSVIKSSDDLAAALLRECEVASVPGSAFGEGNALRFSYAASEKDIIYGLERISRFLSPAGSPPPSREWLKTAIS